MSYLYNIYDKSFINNISECYYNFILENKSLISDKTINFFLCPGKHYLPSEFCLDNNVIEYFNYILFHPNITILDYIVRNIPLCKTLKIVDYGCGVGLLSIFLSKLGIYCYNYDNFSQIKLPNFHERVKSCLGLDINPVSDILSNDIEMILCSGISIQSNDVLDKPNLKYLLLDGRLNGGLNEALINRNFSLLEEHGLILKIYKKNE